MQNKSSELKGFLYIDVTKFSYVCSPTNISFSTQCVSECASKISWIIDVRYATRFLFDIDTIAFFDDSPEKV